MGTIIQIHVATRHYLFKSVIVIFTLFIAITANAVELRDNLSSKIISGVLKAYGGIEAIKKITSVTAKGQIIDFLNGTEGDYSRYFEHQEKLRIEIMPDQGGEVRILNGTKGFQMGPNGFIETSHAMLQSMIYQYSYLNLPMGFTENSNQISYEAPELHVYIDDKTRLIVKVSAGFNMGMAGLSELATEYHDYRPVEGVMFPFSLVNYAGTTKLSEITLKEIVVNRKIPAIVFLPSKTGRNETQ